MTEEVFDDGVDTITKSMVWDHLNRMLETEIDDGTDSTTVTYTYDQGGRRLKKVVDDGTTTETTVYPYADYEVTTTGSTKTTVNADTQHVATLEDDGSSTTIFFHHDDHLGGANVVTSVVGALVQVIDYFPFGSVRVDDQSSAYDSTQKFTGHELDDDTGLYYAQARYYDSEMGRFISQDPLQMRVAELMQKFNKVPQALNFYSYTINNPLILVDPEGKAPHVVIGVAAGAVVGLGVQVATDIIKWSPSSVGTYIGEALGGATAGAMITANPALGVQAGAIGAATASATAQLIDNGSINAGEVIVDGVVGGATGKLGQSIGGIDLPGQGSWTAVGKQINTKFNNGLINNITVSTGIKTFTSDVLQEIPEAVTDKAVTEIGTYFNENLHSKGNLGNDSYDPIRSSEYGPFLPDSVRQERRIENH